jgi:hypothetical protein
MSLVVSYALKGHVGVITVDNAPINALSHVCGVSHHGTK